MFQKSGIHIPTLIESSLQTKSLFSSTVHSTLCVNCLNIDVPQIKDSVFKKFKFNTRVVIYNFFEGFNMLGGKHGRTRKYIL